MTLILTPSQSSPPRPTNKRGRWGMRNIIWKALPAYKKVTLDEAIKILEDGWPK